MPGSQGGFQPLRKGLNRRLDPELSPHPALAGGGEVDPTTQPKRSSKQSPKCFKRNVDKSGSKFGMPKYEPVTDFKANPRILGSHPGNRVATKGMSFTI